MPAPEPTRLFFLAGLIGSILSVGCLFGGGGESFPPPRTQFVPTATPPPRTPEPLVVGETQAGPTTGTPVAPGETLYTVRSGDTLFGIAAQMNVPSAQQAAWVAEVLRINAIPDASLMRAGQEIRLPRLQATPIPTGTAPAAVAATATRPPATGTPATGTTPTPAPTVVGGGGTYTVVSGDSPVGIAAKLGVPLAQQAAWAEQLVALNNVTATGLQIGQVLQLPAGTPPQPPASPTTAPATPTSTATRTP